MAATSVQLAPISDTDANWRLWCQALQDRFTAGGWVQTADTGQLVISTSTKPAAANAIVGYQVFRSNDGVTGINEIYVKIEYGAGSSVATNPAYWITVGFASNGSGTLTGITSTRFKVITSIISLTTLYWCNLAAGTGWLCLSMFTGSTGGCTFSLERERNSSGAEINSVLLVFCNNTYPTTQVITPTLAYLQEAGVAGQLQVWVNDSDAIVGGNTGLSIQFGQRAGLSSPSKNVFGSTIANMGAVQTNNISITTYGVARNYIICASSPNFGTAAKLLVSLFE